MFEVVRGSVKWQGEVYEPGDKMPPEFTIKDAQRHIYSHRFAQVEDVVEGTAVKPADPTPASTTKTPEQIAEEARLAEEEAKLKADLSARVEALQLELPDELTIEEVKKAVEEAEAKAIEAAKVITPPVTTIPPVVKPPVTTK